MRQISVHGQEKRYHHAYIGINGRLDTIQAAILLAKFQFYTHEIKSRDKLARYYSQQLNKIGIKCTPFVYKKNTSVYAQFTIQVNKREEFQRQLKSEGIPTAIHYPKILPMQPVFEKQVDVESIISENKEAYLASKRVLSLPFHPWLKNSEIDFIISKIEKIISQDEYIK